MYYSRFGLQVNAQSTILTACQRYHQFQRELNHEKIKEQALTFALELKTHLVSTVSESALRNAITFAFESVKEEIDRLEIALSRNFIIEFAPRPNVQSIDKIP